MQLNDPNPSDLDPPVHEAESEDSRSGTDFGWDSSRQGFLRTWKGQWLASWLCALCVDSAPQRLLTYARSLELQHKIPENPKKFEDQRQKFVDQGPEIPEILGDFMD